MTRVGAVEVPTPMLDRMTGPVIPAARLGAGAKAGDPCRVNDHTQLIHDFLEFMRDKDFHLVVGDGFGARLSQTREDDLLAEFFGVDLKAVEEERRALLEAIRSQDDDALRAEPPAPTPWEQALKRAQGE